MNNPALQVRVFNMASQVYPLIRDALETSPVNSNTITPTLLKCMVKEEQGRPVTGHLWIVAYTSVNHGPPRIHFVVSCTDGYMGRYPIFLFTTVPYAYLVQNRDQFVPEIRHIVETLYSRVPPSRVYSVFGPEIITEMFCAMWEQRTGISQIEEPYYHAKISHITAAQLALLDVQYMDSPYERVIIRQATQEDCKAIADLNYGFAAESPPFTLNQAEAFLEAKTLVQKEEIWVYYVQQQGHSPRLTSVVAFSRNTSEMATITKVYTDPHFRGQRRAERLVREVCRFLLFSTGRSHVALFVGIENRAANVYRRVGFVGLDASASQPGDVADPWIEIGFDRAHVDLGHW